MRVPLHDRICMGCSLLCFLNKETREDCPGSKQTHGIRDTVVAQEEIERNVVKARMLLKQSRRPLFWGMGASSCELQEQVWKWVERSNGYLVFEGSRSVIQGNRLWGGFACTIEDIREQSDLLILVGDDLGSCKHQFLRQAHAIQRKPRILELSGKRGIADSDFRKTNPQERWAQLGALRRQAVDREPAGDIVEMIRTSAYPVIVFFGDMDENEASQWGELVGYLNERTRCMMLHIRAPGNASGAEQVCLRMGGSPGPMDFTGSLAQPLRGRNILEKMSKREAYDLAVIIEPEGWMEDGRLRSVFAGVPKILLGMPREEAQSDFDAQLPISESTRTSFIRCDGMMIWERRNRGPHPTLEQWEKLLTGWAQ